VAFQQFDLPEIGQAVLKEFDRLDDASRATALSLLACRASWALQLLEAVDAGRISRGSVDSDTLARIKTHTGQNRQISALLQKLWARERAPTTAEMQQQIKHFADSIRSGNGDPYEGRKLFRGSCAVCHKLFGEGGQIGPDLTPYKRDDLDTTLLNVVNPNAEIREGYENQYVTTRDGRSLSGFLADKDSQVIVLRGVDGASIVIPQAEIQEMKAAGVSLMPEGLLSALNDQQVRDLFAYLRSTQPLVGEPPRTVSSK
jgi:putative heme-binding domain-containing protein